MALEENNDGAEVKRTSKLTALIAQENEGINGLQVTVYYSENNWETCEEINLILDDNTTINQLIDSSIYKFKTELFYDNIDKKQFNVMLFKKKTKKPNDEYPICNPESKVKDYGKNQFCLVEDVNSKKEEINKGNETEDTSNNIIEEFGDNDKQLKLDGIKQEKQDNNIKGYDKCNRCKII